MLRKVVTAFSKKNGELTPLELRSSALQELSEEEHECLRSLQEDKKQFGMRRTIIGEGDSYKATYIACDGWAYRFKDLPDGRRQILNFVLPGDTIGIYACLSPVSSTGVETVTPFTVAKVPKQTILDVFASRPRLGALLCWCASQDEAILREQVVRVGRRSAYERTAHLLLELLKRLQRIHEAEEMEYAFPLTQEMVADTLGLTVVHVNRVLRRLRENGMIRIEGKSLEILDRRGLVEAAQFEADYLEAHPLPAETRAKLAAASALS